MDSDFPEYSRSKIVHAVVCSSVGSCLAKLGSCQHRSNISSDWIGPSLKPVFMSACATVLKNPAFVFTKNDLQLTLLLAIGLWLPNNTETLLRNLVVYRLPILRVQDFRVWITGVASADLPPLSLVAKRSSAAFTKPSSDRAADAYPAVERRLMLLALNDRYYAEHEVQEFATRLIRLPSFAEDEGYHSELDLAKDTRANTLALRCRFALALKGGCPTLKVAGTAKGQEHVLWTAAAGLRLPLVCLRSLRNRMANGSLLDGVVGARTELMHVSFVEDFDNEYNLRRGFERPEPHNPPIDRVYRIHVSHWLRMRDHPLQQWLFSRLRFPTSGSEVSISDASLMRAFCHLLDQLFLDVGASPWSGVLPTLTDRKQGPPSVALKSLVMLMRTQASYQLAAVVIGIPSLLSLFELRPAAAFMAELSAADAQVNQLDEVVELTAEAASRESLAKLLQSFAEQPQAGVTFSPTIDSERAPLRDLFHGVADPAAAFLAAFHARTGGLLRQLDWTRFMVAGGLPLSIVLASEGANLQSESFATSDVDLFAVGKEWSRADAVRSVLRSLHAELKAQDKVSDAVVLLCANAVSIIVPGFPVIQVVLRRSLTAEHVLQNFDLDCVGVGFHAERLYLSQRCIRALATGRNLFDNAFTASPYFYRLQKYRKRGFGVTVPGLASCPFGGDSRGFFARMEEARDPIAEADTANPSELTNNYDGGALLTAAMIAEGIEGVKKGLLVRIEQAAQLQIASSTSALHVSFCFDVLSLANADKATQGWTEELNFLSRFASPDAYPTLGSPYLSEVFERFGIHHLSDQDYEGWTYLHSSCTLMGALPLNEGRFRGVRLRDDWFLLHQLRSLDQSPALFLAHSLLLRADGSGSRGASLFPPLSLWDAVAVSTQADEEEEASCSAVDRVVDQLGLLQSLHSSVRMMWPHLQEFFRKLDGPAPLARSFESAQNEARQAIIRHAACTDALIAAYADEHGDAAVRTELDRASVASRAQAITAVSFVLDVLTQLRSSLRAVGEQVDRVVGSLVSECPMADDMTWHAQHTAWAGLEVDAAAELAVRHMLLRVPLEEVLAPLDLSVVYVLGTVAEHLAENESALAARLTALVQHFQLSSVSEASRSLDPEPFAVPPPSFWAVVAFRNATQSFLNAACDVAGVRLTLRITCLSHVISALLVWLRSRAHWLHSVSVGIPASELSALQSQWTREHDRLLAETSAAAEVDAMNDAYNAANDAVFQHNGQLLQLRHRVKSRKATAADKQQLRQLESESTALSKPLRGFHQRLTQLAMALPSIAHRFPELFELGANASTLLQFCNVQTEFQELTAMPQRASLFLGRRKPDSDDDDAEAGAWCVLKMYSSQDDLLLMRRSIELLQSVHHPCVLPLQAVIRDEDRWALQFPLCRGGTLRDWMAKPEWDRKAVLRQLVATLAHLHSLSYAHRDLKPENVLMTEDGQPKLCDFDFSSQQDSHSTMLRGIGTDGYRDPAVITNDAHGSMNNSCSDVFALGVICHEVWLGRKPVLPFSAKQATAAHAAAAQAAGAATPTSKSMLHLFPLLERMLASKQRDRPTAAQLQTHEFFNDSDSSDIPTQSQTSHRFKALVQRLVAQQQAVAAESDPTVKAAFTRVSSGVDAGRRMVPVADALAWAQTLSEASLLHRSKFTFTGEAGIDATGLTKVFYTDLWHQLLSTGLFESDEDKGVFLPTAGADPTSLHAVGVLMMKSLLAGCMVPCAARLSSVVFQFFLRNDVQVNHSDFQEFASPLTYHSLAVQLPQMSDEELANFSFADIRVGEAASDGSASSSSAASALSPSSSLVHSQNVRKYVQAKMQFELVERRRRQLTALSAGMHRLQSLSSTFAHCSAGELQMLFSGPCELTPEHIIAVLIYNPSNPGRMRAMLESWLRAQQRAALVQFLLFVSGLPQVPYSQPRISVVRVPLLGPAARAPLPVAHTCFRQLDLPDYDDADILASKLVAALMETDGAFYVM